MVSIKQLQSHPMNASSGYQKDTAWQCLASPCQRWSEGIDNERQAEEKMDDILVEGMSRLTFQELQQEQDDLHGVAEDSAEKAQEIQRLLDALDKRLSKIKAGTAYESAETMNQHYVSAKEFRLKFLRANRYDHQASADQMIRYFDVKSSLFGTNKLVKDIDLSDLNPDDVKSLCCLISKLKDRANRSVIFFFPGLRRAENLQNELRALFYLYMEVCNSLNSPNRGVVFVLYDVDNFRGNLGGLGVNELSRLFFSMPMHIAGLHVCLGKQQLPATVVAKGVMMFSSSRIKAKTRVHCGSHIECQYLLSTFGIPRNPLQQFCQNQDLIRDHQLAWYHDCVQKETASKQLPVANSLMPKDNDVLYLGRKVQGAGNDRLLALAAQHADWYFDGNSKERRTLIDLMIDEVRKSGGRFLKPGSSGNSMEVLPVEEVRVKISQLFRNLKKRSRLSSQKAPSASPAASPETIRLVEQIRDDDVLFGRMYEHPGNKRLRELVESVSMEYDRSTRGRKKEIADSIVADVKQAGGRFLKPAEGGKWVEVSDNAAELKVSCRFRNVRRKTNDNE